MYDPIKGKVYEANRLRKYGKRPHEQKFHLRKRYGLSLDAFYEILHVQDYKCKICGDGIVCTGKKPVPHNVANVDHDKMTGKVRGLLCGSCNRAIGLLRHDERILASAIVYLTPKAVMS